MKEELRRQIDRLPRHPGVYVMRDRDRRVLYVGKAMNLRARVRSYLGQTGDGRAFVPLLEQRLADVEVIPAETEKEALILEDEIIKREKPRFNTKLREGGHFLYLRIDPGRRYPRLEVTREVKPDGARYFGPYPAARALRETLRVMNRYFQLRTCSDHDPRRHRRPCLLCRISRFSEPSVYDVPAETYRRHVDDAILFLEGRSAELLADLHRRMREAARARRFEEAATIRDRIAAVERTLEPRAARIGAGLRSLRGKGGTERERPESRTAALEALDELRQRLRLSRLPRRIECFDVSHLGGQLLVAAKVAMTDGALDRDRYRRFRVRTVEVGDDVAAMYEAIERRLRRGRAEGDLPHLILVDGGKAQLGAAGAALRDVGIEGIELAALAKPREPASGRGGERVYVAERREALRFGASDPALLLLLRLRDEAHRFAITYQKNLRQRRALRSELDDIAGLGPARQRALLRQLGSVERIKVASPETLAQAPGIGPALARRIRGHFDAAGRARRAA